MLAMLSAPVPPPSSPFDTNISASNWTSKVLESTISSMKTGVGNNSSKWKKGGGGLQKKNNNSST
jgi:hypothetical protein